MIVFCISMRRIFILTNPFTSNHPLFLQESSAFVAMQTGLLLFDDNSTKKYYKS